MQNPDSQNRLAVSVNEAVRMSVNRAGFAGGHFH